MVLDAELSLTYRGKRSLKTRGHHDVTRSCDLPVPFRLTSYALSCEKQDGDII